LFATGFGAASSSCSYAAVAAGRSAFKNGAALVPVLAFMFASTNLVIELGAVLWLLMGWRFVFAEVIGAFVLIGVMWLLMSIVFPRKLEEQARRRANEVADEGCEHHHEHSSAHARSKWTELASAFWMDWSMLWKEIIGGFLIAGFLAALVPSDWWKALFLNSGPPALRLIENAAVGPIVAVASFVCSVGNIPLASLLWTNGISFGGVISFIYGDLIVIPIILIYLKYFGGRAALYITLIFYVSMVSAGIIVDLIFTAAGLIPHEGRPSSAIEHATFDWNYTTWLDLAAIAIALWFLFLTLRAQRRALNL
jgi:Predicted permeases